MSSIDKWINFRSDEAKAMIHSKDDVALMNVVRNAARQNGGLTKAGVEIWGQRIREGLDGYTP